MVRMYNQAIYSLLREAWWSVFSIRQAICRVLHGGTVVRMYNKAICSLLRRGTVIRMNNKANIRIHHASRSKLHNVVYYVRHGGSVCTIRLYGVACNIPGRFDKLQYRVLFVLCKLIY